MRFFFFRVLLFFQDLKKRVTTRKNYNNLENDGETELLSQSTPDTTEGGKDATQVADLSPTKQNQEHYKKDVKSVKLPKRKSRPRWLTQENSATAVSLADQGGGRIAALKQQLQDQQNNHTFKKTFIPLVRSLSEGTVAKRRRSLCKVSGHSLFAEVILLCSFTQLHLLCFGSAVVPLFYGLVSSV